MKLTEQAEVAMEAPIVRSIGGVGNKKKKQFTQYLNQENVKRPYGNASLPPRQQRLEAGVYKIKSDLKGIFFEVHNVNTDELLRFQDERYETVLNEIDDFFTDGRKEKFDTLGFSHKRGVMLYGEPGVGKSCLMKLVMEQMINRDDIVFIANSQDIYNLREGLNEFKEVEPSRNCVVILEDIDEAMRYNEKAFLNLFDGDDQVNGVLYLATTNHLNVMSDRFKRPGRFDRILEIKKPPREGRLAYLQAKLGVNEDEGTLEELADDTDNFSFGQLREFLVAHYCLGQTKSDVLKRLKGIENKDEQYSEGFCNSALDYVFNKLDETLCEAVYDSMNVLKG